MAAAPTGRTGNEPTRLLLYKSSVSIFVNASITSPRTVPVRPQNLKLRAVTCPLKLLHFTRERVEYGEVDLSQTVLVAVKVLQPVTRHETDHFVAPAVVSYNSLRAAASVSAAASAIKKLGMLRRRHQSTGTDDSQVDGMNEHCLVVHIHCCCSIGTHEAADTGDVKHWAVEIHEGNVLPHDSTMSNGKKKKEDQSNNTDRTLGTELPAGITLQLLFDNN